MLQRCAQRRQDRSAAVGHAHDRDALSLDITLLRQPRAGAVRVVGAADRPRAYVARADLVDAAIREAVDNGDADSLFQEDIRPGLHPFRPHRFGGEAAEAMWTK